METRISGDGATARPRAMILPFLILFIVAFVVLGGIYGWQVFIGKMIKGAMAGMATAPQTVSTTIAATTTWQSQTRALGTLRAVRGADLAAQASGVVDKIHIDSGTEVAAGTVLLTLKPNDDPAKLAQLQAAADLAAITLKRDQEQLAAQAIAQATVDSDAATLRSDQAQVAGQKALMEEKTVRAPFAGKLGLRLVDEGQYLAAGTTVVTLQALDPIFIDFYVPQQALGTLKTGQVVNASVDTYPGVKFTGKIASISSKVDTGSRNVQIRASFGNADRRLVPGMYANVEIDNGDATQQITLPQTALTYNPYGDTVYVVQKNGAGDPSHPHLTAVQRFVKVGDTRGDQVAIVGGIAAGDEVVTAGQVKLRSGAAVVVNNQIVPTDAAKPTPPNQ
jgi:membrane fusion protein (multidrug efflux system)